MNLLCGRHGGVPGERGQQRAVRPAEPQRLFGLGPGHQAVEEARTESVAASNAIEHVEFDGRRHVRLAIGPRHRRPPSTIIIQPISQTLMCLWDRRGSELRMMDPMTFFGEIVCALGVCRT